MRVDLGARNRSVRRAHFASHAAGLALVVLASLATIGATPEAIADDGPFVPLAGAWSGTGTITVSKGSNERLRCRATYDVIMGGTGLQLSLLCASDSYNFNLLGSVVNSGGVLSGSWTEATRNAAGKVTGRVTGNQIQASAEGKAFSADLALTTRGDKQSITIKTKGSDVTGATITLARK